MTPMKILMAPMFLVALCVSCRDRRAAVVVAEPPWQADAKSIADASVPPGEDDLLDEERAKAEAKLKAGGFGFIPTGAESQAPHVCPPGQSLCD